jgi:hypothetical protein
MYHRPHSTRCVVIAVSEWTERWEVRSLWRSLGKAESPVRGWWEIRQWNHHTYIQGGSGKKKKLHFYLETYFTAYFDGICCGMFCTSNVRATNTRKELLVNLLYRLK